MTQTEVKINDCIPERIFNMLELIKENKEQKIELDLMIYHIGHKIEGESEIQICSYCSMLPQKSSYLELYSLLTKSSIIKCSEYLVEQHHFKDNSIKTKIYKLKGNLIEYNFERETLINERDYIFGFDNVTSMKFPYWYLQLKINSGIREVYYWMGIHKINGIDFELDPSILIIIKKLIEAMR